LYRQHLTNVYRALGLAAPDELSRPILESGVQNLSHPPTHAIHPVIDGEVTSFFEWMGAGRYQPDNRSGAMHSNEPRIRDVYYGAGAGNLYLRLDCDDGFELNSLEVSTERENVSLLDHSGVQIAKKRIIEVQVPLEAIGNAARFRLFVGSTTIPPEGFLEMTGV
jgi:hypothetical protein